jgi:hypothetical protein
MLIPLPKFISVGTDKWGLIVAINDLYDRSAEDTAIFGNADTRAALAQDIAQYVKEYQDAGKRLGGLSSHEAFYQFFADRLDAYHLKPFSNIRVAFIAPYGLETAQPIINRFKEFISIGEEHDTPFLTTENAHQLIPDKVDYVITGNVLNDDINHDQISEFTHACAHILKEKGRVIHMVNYMEERPSEQLGDPAIHEAAGQKNLYNIPPGPYRPTTTQIMVLEQVREVNRDHPSPDTAKGQLHDINGKDLSAKGHPGSSTGRGTSFLE